MNKILQDLYDGEIYPAEQYLPKIEEYKIIRKKQYTIMRTLSKKSEVLLIRNLRKLWTNS